MTGLVGSGAEPAMLSKKAFTVLVILTPVPLSSRSKALYRDVSMALTEVAESFLLSAIVSEGVALGYI